MARKLRYRPESGILEITQRVAQGRFLLRPGERVNQLLLGVLGLALEKYQVKLLAFAFLSNHYHLLIYFDDIDQLSPFMAFVSGNIAREMNRLHGWSGPFWHERYKSTPVSTEPEAQIARLRYILEQGTKEGLVASPHQWPGANGLRSMLGQDTTIGVWVDRTALSRAKKSESKAKEEDFSTLHPIALSPLPCLEDSSGSERREVVRNLVQGIEMEAAGKHREAGTKPLGAKAVLAKSPFHLPKTSKRRPAPFCHAASASARKAMIQAYKVFEVAFRQAVEALKRGMTNVAFPENCFPPALLIRKNGLQTHPGYG